MIQLSACPKTGMARQAYGKKIIIGVDDETVTVEAVTQWIDGDGEVFREDMQRHSIGPEDFAGFGDTPVVYDGEETTIREVLVALTESFLSERIEG